MTNEEGSPDSEITIRKNRTSMPKFADVDVLPTPLRELQKSVNAATATPPHPSELTVLANRLRKIHLDASTEKTSTPAKDSVTPGKPTRLEFDDVAVDPARDKENVRNGVVASGPAKLEHAPKSVDSDGGDVEVQDTAVSEKERERVQETAASEEEQKSAEAADTEVCIGERSGDASEPEHKHASDFEKDERGEESVDCTKKQECNEGDSVGADLVRQSDSASASEGTNEAVESIETKKDEKVENVVSAQSVEKDSHEEIGKKVTSTEPGSMPKLSESDRGEELEAEGNSEDTQEEDLTGLKESIKAVLEGKEGLQWQKRCEAMSTISAALMSSPSTATLHAVKQALPQLSSTINDNLDEMHPSIIASALGLINAIVESKADVGFKFAMEVFPGVMDFACGRSLNAQEAAKTLSLMLSCHPDLSPLLEDADNGDRLCELLEIESKRDEGKTESALRAMEALKAARAAISKDASANVGHEQGALASSPSIDQKVQSSTPAAAEAHESVTRSPESKASKETREYRSPIQASAGSPSADTAPLGTQAVRTGLPFSAAKTTPRHKRISERLEAALSSEVKGTPRHSVRNRVSELRSNVIRNMKLGESARKISPGSSRKKRIYTEEEMEEARRAAMRMIMEETSQAHAKERERFQAERFDLEKQLRKEQSEVSELKAVLEEYEQTMQKMVSQGNSQASAYASSLEKENKKLKAELLEATEAYDSIKERYDAGKQAVTVFEKKEVRFIEQIKDLKKNMGELQKWSNDLKANSEKKLAKAFENVTTYRASYLDKEAHLSKAISDLERVRKDLEKETANHAETAASLSRQEASLHEEQDARSSVEASLSTCKASLARVTSQKERVQTELETTQQEMHAAKVELAKMKDADVRACDAGKQLDMLTVENQSLKARAYDDMTRIRSLQGELDEKEKEYEEMSAICEEALSQLERMKVEGK